MLRTEVRLPDGVAAGDPLDTALAAGALRLLGRPLPEPVDWRAAQPLLDRTVLALALDHRQLPTVREATTALDGQPPQTVTLGYVAVAYP
ncbi:hypothetical protein AB0H28_28865 [Micromonospora sp. NPDC050980]|uniref:hypothetical protein n=1 Tax=Micromonospora sp. NPDC050980 TaxID=3155161 RepID=UPI0033FD8DDF